MLAESISQLDILNLAPAPQVRPSAATSQVITITMVVTIYYFLHQAGIRMKVFAFARAGPASR